ncbi:Protein FdhD like protein [Lentibacillus sp. JNUCC-1]|uniref:formate dehydrogenase accessory sulfurtransferase FdhD n=1 Tax=Lentibacillus sp. JNUCC-1 TaxID=2654513 RepID=UPI0012E83DD2|nr:formate dehydrogenase accessory sulfurtransferase FdhD [Lentibacillus sp. JNUCC-1]MUV36687.1 Protein FdhD like protein [Lentibacillus sp. JNUCC-1]
MTDFVKQEWQIIRFDNDIASEIQDTVAIEYPLTVSLNGSEFATMVCSPTHLQELIIGFLASEGVIRSTKDIQSLQIDETGGFAHVELVTPIDPKNVDHSKRVIGSCCGKSRQFYFQSDVKTAKTIMSQLTIRVDQCFKLMEALQLQSEHFHDTGGVHNAALATADDLLYVHTDIGRHNALDKVYGRVLTDHVPLKDKVIVFSGRVSSEVLLKVSKIGVGIIISKSAPTDLALELARDLNITVIGFARDQKMNVYTHPERIYERVSSQGL